MFGSLGNRYNQALITFDNANDRSPQQHGTLRNTIKMSSWAASIAIDYDERDTPVYDYTNLSTSTTTLGMKKRFYTRCTTSTCCTTSMSTSCAEHRYVILLE